MHSPEGFIVDRFLVDKYQGVGSVPQGRSKSDCMTPGYPVFQSMAALRPASTARQEPPPLANRRLRGLFNAAHSNRLTRVPFVGFLCISLMTSPPAPHVLRAVPVHSFISANSEN